MAHPPIKPGRSAAALKRQQLEEQIHNCAATETEKANMIHSLSKVWMFLSSEIDSWQRRAAQHGCNVEDGDPDCG